MVRALFRVLRLAGDVKAAARGPAAVGRRLVRRRAHRELSTALRRCGL